MKIELTNKNYCATIVEITNLIALDNCDNLVHTSIMGNLVIVSNQTKTGDIGLYFPVECQLQKEYLSNNNLYRNNELNIDIAKKGYFEENGRVRCAKFRGNKSEGLFMPINSIDFITKIYPNIGTNFNKINGINICDKYVIVSKTKSPSLNMKNKGESKLLDNQFKFHVDTEQFYKNLDQINLSDTISITYKMHGTSLVSSYLLCKKPLKWYEKLLKKVGVNIIDKHYDYIYSSRKVIKNPNMKHYYNEDIWGIAHEKLKPFLTKGMTIYAEIVGYLPSGAYIQKKYDYGCKDKEHKIFIYRITQTNVDGQVYEFNTLQIQKWCKQNGLTPVPLLYYRNVARFFSLEDFPAVWETELLKEIKELFNEKNCYICKNKVPAEGCVIRVENSLDFKAFKQKSTRFLEYETKLKDKNIIDIEENN